MYFSPTPGRPQTAPASAEDAMRSRQHRGFDLGIRHQVLVTAASVETSDT